MSVRCVEFLLVGHHTWQECRLSRTMVRTFSLSPRKRAPVDGTATRLVSSINVEKSFILDNSFVFLAKIFDDTMFQMTIANNSVRSVDCRYQKSYFDIYCMCSADVVVVCQKTSENPSHPSRS